MFSSFIKKEVLIVTISQIKKIQKMFVFLFNCMTHEETFPYIFRLLTDLLIVICPTLWQYNITIAVSNILVAMILVLSNMSLPGPDAKHLSLGKLHNSFSWSQTFPENSHFAPFVFGETSPRLVDANAQTIRPWNIKDNISISNEISEISRENISNL